MLYADYEKLAAIPGTRLPDPTLTIGHHEGFCIVNGLYPFPVVFESASFERGEVLDIEDEQHHPVGMLLTCKGEEYELNRFSDGYLAAYLRDVTVDRYAKPGTFLSDYIVVQTDRLSDYKSKFMESSVIWGGFWHTDTGSVQAPVVASAIQPIIARSGIKIPTDLHREAAKRSAMLPYAFERYLKLYHLLELSFDHDTVQRIQSLGNDLQGIGKILSLHRREEFDRLKQLIKDKCTDSSSIAANIEELCREPKWHATMREIFFDYGKDGNPFKDNWPKFEQMLAGPGFTQNGALTFGWLSKKTPKDDFNRLTLEVVAYWIYRVRCSIAHSRIGEYVMKSQDEEFVEQFAEKLLRQVLVTVLR